MTSITHYNRSVFVSYYSARYLTLYAVTVDLSTFPAIFIDFSNPCFSCLLEI